MVKAYSYIRFSSAKQASGDSIRRQLELSQEWATEEGVELDTTLRDYGVSAFTGDNRVKGALSKFLARIEAGDRAGPDRLNTRRAEISGSPAG